MTKYYVHNTGRKIATKAARVAAPYNRVSPFLFGSLRIARNRGIELSEEQVRRHWDRLHQLQIDGRIQVRVGGPSGPIFGFGAADVPVPEPKEPERIEEPEAPKEPEAVKELVAASSEDVLGFLDEEPEDDGDEGAGPDDLMALTKSTLVEMAVERTGRTASDLSKLKKAELAELLS